MSESAIGKLYVCPTPIGNLEDITLRVLRVLREVNLIAAEDTRNSIKLLNYYNIKTKMTSYHEFNKYEKADKLIECLNRGDNIALITDAGSPGISDPGFELIKKCYDKNINVEVLPGAIAFTTAIIKSGFDTTRMAFEAFLPKDKKKRKYVLSNLKDETRTVAIYESPYHLIKTLLEIREYLGVDRRVALIKELTKKYENKIVFQLKDIEKIASEETIKGEYVIVIEGKTFKAIEELNYKNWENYTIKEHMKLYDNLPRKEAMKAVAKDRGISKREVYSSLL